MNTQPSINVYQVDGKGNSTTSYEMPMKDYWTTVGWVISGATFFMRQKPRNFQIIHVEVFGDGEPLSKFCPLRLNEDNQFEIKKVLLKDGNVFYDEDWKTLKRIDLVVC